MITNIIITNINKLYNAPEKAIDLFNDFITIASETKY